MQSVVEWLDAIVCVVVVCCLLVLVWLDARENAGWNATDASIGWSAFFLIR